MIKDSLKKLNIKITELADYLKISRPTMYKFIELYDSNNFKDINKKIKKLFEFIDNNKLIEKRNVINYILNNLNISKEFEDNENLAKIKRMREYFIKNPNTEKTFFIDLILKVSYFDVAIHYLCEISLLLKKKKHSKEEEEKLLPYKKIIDLYTSHIKNEEK